MKYLALAAAVLVLILAVAGGFLYARNESRARTLAEEALDDFRARRPLDAWKRRAGAATWAGRVRILEGDGAAEIRDASLPYREADRRTVIESPSADPDAIPEIALLESAGARARCSLTGSVIPVADNPFQTEDLAGRGLLTLGKIMIAKGKALEARGLREGAEKELLLLLSVGSHLEGDSSWVSFSLGLAIEELAFEALHDLYTGRGKEWAEEAAKAEELRASVSGRRKVIAPIPPLMEMSLSGEGLRVLEGIANDASLERAARTEAILALNAGYLFANNRVLFGPESERREILRHLRLEDPMLAQISAKAQKAILSMSLGERRKSVTTVGVLR